MTPSRPRASRLQELRDSQQAPIGLFLAAGVVIAVVGVLLMLTIPVRGEDFKYYTGYGFNGPFGGGGGFRGLGRW